MNDQQIISWIFGIVISVATIISVTAAGIRWLVKHYLAELKPNGGSSMRDSINRLEAQMELVLELVKNK